MTFILQLILRYQYFSSFSYFYQINLEPILTYFILYLSYLIQFTICAYSMINILLFLVHNPKNLYTIQMDLDPLNIDFPNNLDHQME